MGRRYLGRDRGVYLGSESKVHGYAVAGGSDIALCCESVVVAKDARLPHPDRSRRAVARYPAVFLPDWLRQPAALTRVIL